jgi:nitrile hydratase beta subunit
MNGIHDMGGMEGFGPVISEQDEPVFHEDWEKSVFTMVNRILALTGRNVDEMRHSIERIPPARYLASSYYERWMQAAETLLIERGLVTREELASLPQPERAAAPMLAVAPDERAARSAQPRAKFKAGDHIRVLNLNPHGHTRSPRYARGKAGVIRRDYGLYVLPDTNAHRAGDHRQHVYSVEFTARELWGKGAREKIMIDLWEEYLEPLEKKPATRRRTDKR